MKNLWKNLRKNVRIEDIIKFVILGLLLIYSIVITCKTNFKYILLTPVLLDLFWRIFEKMEVLKKYRRKFYEIDSSIIIFSGMHLCYMGILMEKQYKWVAFIFFILFLLNSFFISELMFKSRLPILIIYFVILISNVIFSIYVNKIAFLGAILLSSSNIITGVLMFLEKNKKWDKINFGLLYIPAQIFLITSCVI